MAVWRISSAVSRARTSAPNIWRRGANCWQRGRTSLLRLDGRLSPWLNPVTRHRRRSPMDPRTPIGRQPLGLDALALMRVFLRIADADDRQKVIELATALAPDAS